MLTLFLGSKRSILWLPAPDASVPSSTSSLLGLIVPFSVLPRSILLRSIALIVLILAPSAVVAQVEQRGHPLGLDATSAVATVRLDEAAPKAGNALPPAPAESARGMQFLPAQYGARVPARIDVRAQGTRRDHPDGGAVWYVRVQAEGARALRLSYDQFRLPHGAQFFVYDPDRRVVHGAFTAANHTPHGGFATALTPGPEVVLEYYEPPDASFPGRVRVETVTQAHAPPPLVAASVKSTAYEPTALSCSINTACPEGDPWRPEARATVLIDRGGSACSGVLLNNTSEDLTPYILTAHHCGTPAVGDTLNWLVHFNYASPTCANPTDAPPKQTMAGVVVRAAHAGWREDFALLELVNPLPASYQAYYAGWAIDEAGSTASMTPSHPGGAVRKMALEGDPLTDLGARWLSTLDHGTVEGGSSGAPLFDVNHRVIGHLRGAWSIDLNACSGPGGDDNAATVVFPKLSHIWDLGDEGARVRDFLDPQATGTMTLDGLDSAPSSPAAAAWINEMDTRTAETSAADDDEFIELAGPAGYLLDGHTVDVYTCSDGQAVHAFTEPIHTNAPLANDHDGIGFFVLGGAGLPDDGVDQRFAKTAVDQLADGAGLVVLRDPSGRELFDYQYDVDGDQHASACPASRTTRSAADDYSYTAQPNSVSTSAGDLNASLGSTAIGFQQGTLPTATAAGTEGMLPSPGSTNDTAMPVQLSGFWAMIDGEAAQLRWATAGETNNAGFEVQHAMDGDFVTRAFVEGHGTTSQPQRYAFTTSGLITGTHRFRLRQVDTDGTASLSPVVAVQVTASSPYELTRPAPNPFHESATLTLTVTQPQQVEAMLYDVLGRRVATLHRGPVPAHQPTPLRVDGDVLSSGLYIVRVIGDGFAVSHKVTVLQ